MKLAVLFGGISSEHDISCLSAASILRNLNKDKYEIYPVGITRDGEWCYCPDCDPDRVESGAWERMTGKVKVVSREMMANPKVELCAFDGETWLRVSAKAVEDDRVQARQDLLDHYPELQSLYTADDGNTQVFALTEATATFSSFQAAPRVVRW